MSEATLRYRMKQVINKAKSYYLPKLYRWEKQILDITTFLSQVYSTNAAYQKIFSCANQNKQKFYDYCKSKLNENIQKFYAEYK